MPDESCRKCGGELDIFKSCSDCRKPTQKKCRRCSGVTPLQPHRYCVSDVLPNPKPLIVPTIQSGRSSKTRNSYYFSLVAIGAIGFFMLGLAATYSGVHQMMPDEAQATTNNTIQIPSGFPAPNAKSYDNCLAYGSGESITVTCPTGDGSVYKGILNMPQDLKKDFADSVFSIRGMSITENPDGSVTMQYHLQKYVTTYFGN